MVRRKAGQWLIIRQKLWHTLYVTCHAEQLIHYESYTHSSCTNTFQGLRVPGVYSAITKVLEEVRRTRPDFKPSSLLDFGSGPGSVIWAAREVFGEEALQYVDAVEPSDDMWAMGADLRQSLPSLDVLRFMVSECRWYFSLQMN